MSQPSPEDFIGMVFRHKHIAALIFTIEEVLDRDGKRAAEVPRSQWGLTTFAGTARGCFNSWKATANQPELQRDWEPLNEP